MDSSELLDEVNHCLIEVKKVEETLMEIWKRIVPGEELPKGLSKPKKKRYKK